MYYKLNDTVIPHIFSPRFEMAACGYNGTCRIQLPALNGLGLRTSTLCPSFQGVPRIKAVGCKISVDHVEAALESLLELVPWPLLLYTENSAWYSSP